MTKLEQFFYDNAGYSYDSKTETARAGRMRGARELARAAQRALENDWTYEWSTDDICCCEVRDHQTEYCLLLDGDTVLASLCGICGATDSYRRVIQAELALEALRASEAK